MRAMKSQLIFSPAFPIIGSCKTGQTRTIARSDIRTLRASNVSVMPEGLENSVSVEQMRDLLVFLKKGGTHFITH